MRRYSIPAIFRNEFSPSWILRLEVMLDIQLSNYENESTFIVIGLAVWCVHFFWGRIIRPTHKTDVARYACRNPLVIFGFQQRFRIGIMILIMPNWSTSCVCIDDSEALGDQAFLGHANLKVGCLRRGRLCLEMWSVHACRLS